MNLRSFAGKVGIDYEKTIEDFCGDVNTLKEKLLSFTEDCRIEEFEDALDDGNPELIKSIAHKIGKESEKVGLSPLSKAAKRVDEVDNSKLKGASENLIRVYDEIKEKLDEEAKN